MWVRQIEPKLFESHTIWWKNCFGLTSVPTFSVMWQGDKWKGPPCSYALLICQHSIAASDFGRAHFPILHSPSNLVPPFDKTIEYQRQQSPTRRKTATWYDSNAAHVTCTRVTLQYLYTELQMHVCTKYADEKYRRHKKWKDNRHETGNTAVYRRKIRHTDVYVRQVQVMYPRSCLKPALVHTHTEANTVEKATRAGSRGVRRTAGYA